MLLELFAEEVPLVPRPDFDDPKRQPGIKPAAFNLKSPRAYLKNARAFYLQRTKEHLSIRRMDKRKMELSCGASMEKGFRLNQLDELIDYLIERTSNE